MESSKTLDFIVKNGVSKLHRGCGASVSKAKAVQKIFVGWVVDLFCKESFEVE